jgi:hypothetical protein
MASPVAEKECVFEDVDYTMPSPFLGLSESCPFHKTNHAQPDPVEDESEKRKSRLKVDFAGNFAGDDISARLLVISRHIKWLE